MKHYAIFTTITCAFFVSHAYANEQTLTRQVKQLKQQTIQLKQEVKHIEHAEKKHAFGQGVMHAIIEPTPKMQTQLQFHNSGVSVHSLDVDPESLEFYPTAL